MMANLVIYANDLGGDSLGQAGSLFLENGMKQFIMFNKAQNRMLHALSLLLENLWASAVQFSSIYLTTI